MADTIEDLAKVRQERIENPTGRLVNWQKRATGRIEHLPGGGTVVRPEAFKGRESSRHAAGADEAKPAMLDHRRPGIEEGVTRAVRPESCPPCGRGRETLAAVVSFVPDVALFVGQLERVRDNVQIRSDNRSPAIPELHWAVQVAREWLDDLRRGCVRPMLVTYPMMLESRLGDIENELFTRWGDYAPEVITVRKLRAMADAWMRGQEHAL